MLSLLWVRSSSSLRSNFLRTLLAPSRRHLSPLPSTDRTDITAEPESELPHRIPKSIPPHLVQDRISFREKGYYAKFQSEFPPETLKALTLERIDEAFAPWIVPNPLPQTTIHAGNLRILLHQIGQRWPLTSPFTWSCSNTISRSLHKTWDYHPPFPFPRHPPPADFVKDLKAIREMVGMVGLPEWDTELGEPVDLDWSGAAAITCAEAGKEGDDAEKRGGLGATFDDLWASWAWTDEASSKRQMSSMTSVLPLTLGLHLALQAPSKLLSPHQNFRQPLSVRAVSPHAAQNLLDNYSRFPSCNADLKDLHLLMARNRIAKLVPYWHPEAKRPETPAGHLAKRRVGWLLKGNFKLRRRPVWVELPAELRGKLVQFGVGGEIKGPEEIEVEVQEKVASPYDSLR